MKRESMSEFLGLFDAMQGSVKTMDIDVPELFILADPFDGYVRTVTMTPFIPAVLSACASASLIHGVKTVGPKHGITAHKVYELVGIKVDMSADEAKYSVEQNGWAYMDQSRYAPMLYGAINCARENGYAKRCGQKRFSRRYY